MRHPGRGRISIALAVLLLQLLVSPPASGQIKREKILHRLDFAQVEGGIEAHIHFNRPVRYLRHSPKDRGKIVRIEFAPVGVGVIVDEGARRRESLKSNIGKRSPLIEVVHERVPGQRPLLILRFREETEFEVRPGSTARSVTVFMKTSVPARAPTGIEPRVAKGSTRSTEIMAEGRKAMTAAEYTRAAALFELVLSADGQQKEDRENQRAAKELLGLARERNEQPAHARAEYEEYLEQYPEGEAAERVRQRLQALLTVEALPSQALREFTPRDDQDWIEFFGDVSLGYYRGEDLTGDRDASVYESTLISDLDLTSRAELDGYELIGELSLSQDHDFVAGRSQNVTRVSLLSLEAQNPTRTLSGVVGRQTRRDAGVLGRFDGVVLRGQLDDYFSMSGVFGFPLESTTSSGINADRIFLGTAADFEGYIDGATAQLFLIGQLNQDLVDRLALGTEFNYVGGWGYARAFLDYDAYYDSLNLALLSASLNVGDDTRLHAFLQTQTVPFFTLASALQGQSAEDLDELRGDFSKSEIRELARDRTARSYTATLGGSHWLNTDLQVAADLTFVTVGSTSASKGVDGDPGVEANPGTDAEIFASLQVTKNNLMLSGDISSISFRFADGEVSNGYRLFLRSRIPLRKGLHVDPRVSFDYRDHRQGGDDVLTIRPTARLTWDWRHFSVELEGGLDTLQYFGAQSPDPEVSYIVEILTRYEF